MAFSRGRCIGCRSCVEACPTGILVDPGSRPAPDQCDTCGSCVAACPTEARQLLGRSVTIDWVITAVLRDRVFYDRSGGGVTFSGGEPLAQADFLLACLAACRQRGIHTAVDTCGYGSRRAVVEVGSLANIVLFDLKVLDPDRHMALTGVPLELILDNLRTLDAASVELWLRIPVVPGYTDDDANIQAIIDLAAATPSVRRVSLLPFHRTGEGKLDRIGGRSPGETITEPSDAMMARLATRFAASGLETAIGG